MMDSILIMGPWILSILAAAQFWIWLAMRRRGGRRGLELYESGSIVVGYDANGPTLALAGVLRSPDAEVFVRAVKATLTSDKDKEKREFGWMAFRPDFRLNQAGAGDLEMPHPFLVSPGGAGRFNIVFRDVEAFPQVEGIMRIYRHHWRETEGRITEWRERHAEAGHGSHDALVADFKKQEACVSAYTELDRKCYWEQGSYALTIEVETEGGAADLARAFRFTLGKMDAKLLKTNCVTMLDEPIAAALGKPQVPCRSVQTDYVRAVAE